MEGEWHMDAVHRRGFLRRGLAASAIGLAGRYAIGAEYAFAANGDAPTGHVETRLAALRGRRLHLGLSSGELMKAFGRIPRPVLAYDLAQVEEN